ncbi:hypothetical protein N7516_009430 [Penicillium verrucosum]|uniref:uncharacterized protein n=1 Tax=Penicillium verrucosum TaxID=60171 RepID=UPI0025453788|nr:uncharacterized protein N7516_009430 [Penicillium verrucosum]KAJ5927657.1 hypothetical protein N7516_009430 [Penicillium verrucosum]
MSGSAYTVLTSQLWLTADTKAALARRSVPLQTGAISGSNPRRRQVTGTEEGLADQAAGQLGETGWKEDGGERDKPGGR